VDTIKKENENENQDFNCATVNTKSEIISMCVVPVIVRHKFSNRMIKTYAMLDTCSQATFAKINLLSNLGIQGRKTSITVKTMNGEITKASEVIEDLEVTEASNKNEEKIWLKLPRTFTQEDLPVDSSEVAIAENIWIE